MLEFISKSIVSNRKKKGLTQEELAEKLDVSSAAISKWESINSHYGDEILCNGYF